MGKSPQEIDDEFAVNIARARADLEVLQSAREDFRREILEIKVGDIVKYKSGEAKVTRVDVTYCRWRDGKLSAPWVYVVKKKKDGSWSSLEHSLYDNWEKLDATPPASVVNELETSK